MVDLPVGTVTFLFTDIEGSTTLWENQPDAMRPTLAYHDQLLRQVVEQNRGVIVKTTGDGIMAAFTVALDGLKAAVAAQLALQTSEWPESLALKVRMGLHTGTAELRDGDYFGPVLNRAARLMAAGHGGQILTSTVTQELCRDALPNKVSLLLLGTHRLKDLNRPETVFQVQHASLPGTFPPLRSLDNTDYPNNLPQQLTSFIGREKEMAEVKRLLTTTRLLTLMGAGGLGKTRLSLQVAADVLEEYPDGVYFVELAPISDPGLIVQTVAQVLKVQEKKGEPLLQTVTDYLKNRRLLLLLDNCEHLIAACAQFAAHLMRSCSQLRLLTTSRERLGIVGELTYRLPTLSVPERSANATPESLSVYEAVRLFIERAQFHNPHFAVTNQNAPAVAQLCHRLDGIPLALELAAARVRSIPVEEINNRLDSRFRLLVGGDRTALPRQQTLRALVDWSYELLGDTEKRLLASLSVFSGGWTLEAAEAVCADDAIEDWEVLDLLTSLADKSLVLADLAEDTTRYGMLETIRHYTIEKLGSSGMGEPVRERHLEWALRLAREAEGALTGTHQREWLSRLEREHDNFRAALSWQVVGSRERRMELATRLSHFWRLRGYTSEGREQMERLLDPRPGEPTTLLAKALQAGAEFYSIQGENVKARSLYEEALAMARSLRDPPTIALVLLNYGMATTNLGEYTTSRNLLNESLSIYRMLGDKQGIAHTLGDLGLTAIFQSDFATAQELYEECLAMNRELGNRLGIARAVGNLGTVVMELGDPERGQALREESLAIYRELGIKRNIAVLVGNLGNAAAAKGDYVKARACFEEALTLFREMGDQQGTARLLCNLGGLSRDEGDLKTAYSLQRESLILFREFGDKRSIAYVLEAMAELALRNGDAATSATVWASTDVLRDAFGIKRMLSEITYREKVADDLRAVLGEAALTEATEAGRVMTWEQAVAFVLDR